MNEISDSILEYIKNKESGNPVAYNDIVNNFNIPEKEIDEIINDFLISGDIFEPVIGHFKIL